MDKYQGQQNEYVLLSLVRTRAVGHLRDVRRLVVAFSRARLGLYIFGRASVFANCYELQPAFRCLSLLYEHRVEVQAGPTVCQILPTPMHVIVILYGSSWLCLCRERPVLSA